METSTVSARALRAPIGAGALGTVALLVGLAWDARLHAADPGLAASEGIFSMTNPGHLLAAAGIFLVTAGVAAAAWIVWVANRSMATRVVAALALALVLVSAGGVAVASGAAEAGHVHAAPHPHEVPHAHGMEPATDEPAMADDPVAQPGRPEDSDAAHRHSHERDYDSLWAAASSEERAAATKLVEDTAAATAQYEDFDAALAAGYRANPQGGVNATHHPNRSLTRDGRVLDPSAPESLMYWTARDGRKVLVGVVYKTTPSESAPAPGGELTAWHTHTGDRKCYPAQDVGCPQDTGKMLHVFFYDGAHDPFTENMVAAAGGRDAFVRAMREPA